jgi:hypothetical protein
VVDLLDLARRPRRMVSVTAFSFSGRFSVSVATPSFTS